MSAFNLRQLFLNHVAQTSTDPLAIEVIKAEGVYIHTHNKTFIDCISGIAVNQLGHAVPEIIEAVNKQMNSYAHTMVYGEMIQSPQVQLAHKLSSVLPENLNSVYFVNSGSEAIEGAMKLAKRLTGRFNFVAQKLAYHGSTHGALSLMSDEFFSSAFYPLLPGIDFLEQNKLESIEQTINESTAAVFVEPIMGEKGYVPCQLDYLKKIRQRCNDVGALLVFDEIQTGYGRTGKLFAFEHFDLVPDVLVLAKGFGGGLPLGAFISSKENMSVLTHNPVLGHITTFGGHPVSCAASLAALNLLLEKNYISQIDEKEQLFRKLLIHPKIKNISGKGLMLALEFESSVFCRKVIDSCVNDGLLIDWFLFAENKIRLSPPLIINNEQIMKICGTIIENINKIEATI
jgi:acetylornithine/succinyldiaminopimelate/putrescine aminotransferase